MLAGLVSAATAAAAQIEQDQGGNRIERFGETGMAPPVRNCTGDRRWCGELVRGRPSRAWTLRIVERRPGPAGEVRTHLFAIPAEYWGAAGGGIAVWQTIVREGRGAALVGFDLSRTTGGRPGFLSFQRRLLLLRVAPEDGAIPVPVLDAPLSGYVDHPLCAATQDRRGPPQPCGDLFRLSASFTLAPSASPERPGLVMAVSASARRGRRSRDSLVPPLEPNGVPDPACSYTRRYDFDAARGRYVPDAPLPACRDYLEP